MPTPVELLLFMPIELWCGYAEVGGCQTGCGHAWTGSGHTVRVSFTTQWMGYKRSEASENVTSYCTTISGTVVHVGGVTNLWEVNHACPHPVWGCLWALISRGSTATEDSLGFRIVSTHEERGGGKRWRGGVKHSQTGCGFSYMRNFLIYARQWLISAECTARRIIWCYSQMHSTLYKVALVRSIGRSMYYQLPFSSCTWISIKNLWHELKGNW